MSLDLGFQHNQKYEGGKSRTSTARLAPQPIIARPRACFLRLANTMGYSNDSDGMSQHSRVKLREFYFC